MPKKYIYAIAISTIQNKTFVKIGISNNPFRRLKELQTGNPFKLLLLFYFIGNLKDEKKMLRMFNKYKIRGEWFYLNIDKISNIFRK